MRPAWGRLAGQALCAGDELETESLLHQLSNAEVYVGLSTAEGDSLTICNANQPHNTSNGIVRNRTENSVIKITHDFFSFLGNSIVVFHNLDSTIICSDLQGGSEHYFVIFSLVVSICIIGIFGVCSLVFFPFFSYYILIKWFGKYKPT